MKLLGVSTFYHDSAAALVEGGRVVAAAQEERFTRVRHDASFPARAITASLETAGWRPDELDHVVLYEKPLVKFERLLSTYLHHAPHGWTSFVKAMPLWLGEKLLQRRLLERELKKLAPDVDWHSKLLFSEHHLSHAASAFYPSPFERAAVLTFDGVGEWETTTIGVGHGRALDLKQSLHFPHSIGFLYSAFTYHLGFRVNSGEYKVMGLAPYGTPKFADLIRAHLIDARDDGSFALDQSYFDYAAGLTMTSPRFETLLGVPRRGAGEPLTSVHSDLAASVQAVTEELVLRIAAHAARTTGERNLCLAGGVALNGVANAAILRSGLFDRVWVQPAAGDAGGAIGAALAVAHLAFDAAREQGAGGDGMRGALLGPGYSDDEIASRLERAGALFARAESVEAMIAWATDALISGETVGWFQGRMEFGPRALGARSILADPRRPEMQARLNAQVKQRESFRPFAPAVLLDSAASWFDLKVEAPYMQYVVPLAANRRSDVPAVTHVDGSARVQTVLADTNPRFHALLTEFHRRTGCPMLVNTSYNLRGEPIVESPEDAWRCLMESGLDVAVIGRCLLRRAAQDPALKSGYSATLVPD